MRFSFQTSTGKLMLLVIVTALELVLFQDVWWILVIPSITIVTLALNLGLWFVLLRRRWMETRIIGMLLGGVAAALGIVLYMSLGVGVVTVVGYQQVGPIGALADNHRHDVEAILARPGGESGDAPPHRGKRCAHHRICSARPLRPGNHLGGGNSGTPASPATSSRAPQRQPSLPLLTTALQLRCNQPLSLPAFARYSTGTDWRWPLPTLLRAHPTRSLQTARPSRDPDDLEFRPARSWSSPA